ncbi:MAG: hypothetical protein LBC74_06335 [Planctomycetaceae bacterium]|jgi:hypothetical protein|nr:hypothetical protein [Planctomycetaceae bacterium]
MKKTILLLSIFLLFSGCQAIRSLFERSDPKPMVRTVSAKPSLSEIIDPINRNSQMIRTISADNVSLAFSGVSMPLNVRLTCERPKRIRIIGGTSITGQELDFGSNDELFWIWVKREQDLYFCRHSQFPSCPVRNILPIDPDWLIEALGIVEFKDSERHEGPYPTDDGNWTIITRRSTQTGQFVKKTTIDAKTGLVSKQEIFSPQNELITSALSSDYRFDVENGIIYARKIEIYYAASTGKSTISINLGSPQFNQTTNTYSSMYTMPTYNERKPVDICSEEFLRSRNINPAPLTNTPLPPITSPTTTPPASTITPTPNTSAAIIPSTLSNNTIHNTISQNNDNNIPTYRYNNTATSQDVLQTEIK